MANRGGATHGSMPVGFRFHPTDEELVGHYLKNKLLGDGSLTQIIAEVDVCKMEPWDLPAFSKVKSDDLEWFFFSPRDLKYTNSKRSNRATVGGYWKVTGKERTIKTRGTNDVIGTKKILIFYEGRVPYGMKTNWIIHEYHAITIPESQVYSLPEVSMDSILQATVSIQQEPPFQYASVTDTYYGNENNSNKFLIETTEVEDNIDEFWNSILINEDVSFNEERLHASIDDFALLESLKGTDSELVQHG